VTERPQLLDISHRIHALAELSFREHASAALLRRALKAAGYDVTDVDGVPTAFVGSHGTGPTTVAICLEYDALPGVGHACGHNVIAAAGVGAALALVDVRDVRVLVVGCPAEEDGGGKALLIDRGVFDGVDAALMVHPHSIERDAMATLALGEYRITFAGGDAEAAVALVHLAVGQLRERLSPEQRVHGINLGGGACAWTIRAATLHDLTHLRSSLSAIIDGAALMTGCSSEFESTSPEYAELRTDDELAELWRANAQILGRRSMPRQPDDPLASTDMGNVSHVVPSIHPLVMVDAGSTIHQHAFAAAAVGTAGDQAVVDAAALLAWTVIDFVERRRVAVLATGAVTN
jgi:metal-dependent amidase/aminoacylase/carboxypeptidase family protein